MRRVREREGERNRIKIVMRDMRIGERERERERNCLKICMRKMRKGERERGIVQKRWRHEKNE